MLNSLLTIPKMQSNGRIVNGSFGTVLVSALKDKGYRLISVIPHKEWKDTIIVQMGTFTDAKKISIEIDGNCSANNIIKKLEDKNK